MNQDKFIAQPTEAGTCANMSGAIADRICSLTTIHGPTNAQARLRLFGRNESDVRVTLYCDNHAWCPYCQKVWLWLEEKQIPYRIEKVTMLLRGERKLV